MHGDRLTLMYRGGGFIVDDAACTCDENAVIVDIYRKVCVQYPRLDPVIEIHSQVYDVIYSTLGRQARTGSGRCTDTIGRCSDRIWNQPDASIYHGNSRMVSGKKGLTMIWAVGASYELILLTTKVVWRTSTKDSTLPETIGRNTKLM